MTQKTNSFPVFTVLYVIGFLGAGVIGLLSNSFFAYDIFNSLWADAVYLLFLSLIYITAFVSEVFSSRLPFDIVFNAFVFLGSLILLLLIAFFGGVFLFIAEVYSAIMIAIIAIKYALSARLQTPENKSNYVDVKPMLSAMSLQIFTMVDMLTVEFVSETYIAWSLIPAAVIFIIACLVAFFIFKNYLPTMFKTKARLIIGMISVGLLIFILAFIICFNAVGTANCVFDGDPTPSQCTVIDKNITSGSHTVTRHELQIFIDGEKKHITVPSADYFEIEIGDTVTINYYKGALGFAYWSYSKK